MRVWGTAYQRKTVYEASKKKQAKAMDHVAPATAAACGSDDEGGDMEEEETAYNAETEALMKQAESLMTSSSTK